MKGGTGNRKQANDRFSEKNKQTEENLSKESHSNRRKVI
jgi:hypothetical protein